ncbi:hypothetical protein Q8A67_006338 [Cirrhinus molitorella]|uniref:Pyrin domain-containing protein n=1 Tax=Cirrhinus molitorella TaxID=172907 RepID=A0AA88Q7P1_9TELE|nr:hypothetical protein Q8A67_006338 [Cirrhinus molitorella]
MAFVKDLLMNSLKELVNAELKKFQWFLVNDHACLSRSEMENANIFITVDRLVACFGPENAVKITVDILKKMNQNELAEQLENKHKQGPLTLTLCQSSEPHGKEKLIQLRKMNLN